MTSIADAFENEGPSPEELEEIEKDTDGHFDEEESDETLQ